MIKHKQITLDIADGAKSISELLGSNGPFTRIITGPNTHIMYGDSALDVSTNPGLRITNNAIGLDLEFDPDDDMANKLFFAADGDDSTLIIFAW